MRVALVTPYDPFPERASHGDGHVGGVERVISQLARGLVRLGHETTVVCSSADAHDSVVDGVNVVRARRRGSILRAPISDIARRIPDADVVHVAATYPFTTPAAIRQAHRRGVPSILDFHFEPDPVTPTGRIAAWLYGRLGPRAYPLADAVLVRSHAYGRQARSLSNIPPDRWHELPNGIDPSRFYPAARADAAPNGASTKAPHEAPPDDRPILFVGRLVPYKGLGTLLRALRSMPRAPPLLVAGDGPLRAELERLASRLHVDATFLGHVPDESLPDLYRSASLTVLPSVGRQESFGICLLESMACGTPVVASDIPGVRDVATLGGLVAPSGDVASWAKTLEKALGGELPRGERLAHNIQATYSWDAIAARLVSIYETVLEGRIAKGVSIAHPRGEPVL